MAAFLAAGLRKPSCRTAMGSVGGLISYTNRVSSLTEKEIIPHIALSSVISRKLLPIGRQHHLSAVPQHHSPVAVAIGFCS